MRGREVLSGADLAPLSNLPSLVFFNSCQCRRDLVHRLAVQSAIQQPARFKHDLR